MRFLPSFVPPVISMRPLPPPPPGNSKPFGAPISSCKQRRRRVAFSLPFMLLSAILPPYTDAVQTLLLGNLFSMQLSSEPTLSLANPGSTAYLPAQQQVTPGAGRQGRLMKLMATHFRAISQNQMRRGKTKGERKGRKGGRKEGRRGRK